MGVGGQLAAVVLELLAPGPPGEVGVALGEAERGQLVRYFRFYSRARCLVSLEFARCGSRFGFLLDLPQDETQRLLRARVAELGGVIEQRTELVRLARAAISAVEVFK